MRTEFGPHMPVLMSGDLDIDNLPSSHYGFKASWTMIAFSTFRISRLETRPVISIIRVLLTVVS